MDKKYCENCGSLHELAYYTYIKPPYDNMCLCEKCADLPLKSIKRQEFPEPKNRIFLQLKNA
jgi:hypothetical protein